MASTLQTPTALPLLLDGTGRDTNVALGAVSRGMSPRAKIATRAITKIDNAMTHFLIAWLRD